MLCLDITMFKFFRKASLYVFAIPFLFTFLGAASNQLVIKANNDTFPVLVNEAKIKEFTKGEDPLVLSDGTIMLDDTHCVMTSKTHLNLLADNIDFASDGIMSIGDLLLNVGTWSRGVVPYVWGLILLAKLKKEE